MAEKAHQLAFMGRIYAVARRVLVGMGPDRDGNASRASSLLSDLRKRVDDEVAQSGQITWGVISNSSPDDPLLDDERWSSLEILLQLPWFQRGWVVRETGLARKCAACWLGGRDVQIARLPSLYQPLTPHLDAYWDRHNDVARIFHEYGPWQPNRPLDYLSRGRYLHFTDRRDIIFAFLDLATSEEPRLSLNYDQPPRKVFHDFAAHYLRTTGDVTLLEYIAHGDQINKNDLASWVPNWDHLDADTYRDDIGDRYGHSSLMPAYGSFRKPEVLDEELLRVHGAVLDTVEDLLDTFHSATTTPRVIFGLWCHVKDDSSLATFSAEFLAGCFAVAISRNGFEVPLGWWGPCKEAYVQQLLHPTFEAGVLQWNGDYQHVEQN
ncbi:hypothetical protein E8E12_005829 [Didymella heteroderae]|uniref:Heterokaryon incompatibility domain-containing protein n=1 Tax=Didymella heteroderae TaxID=1769908 RepID=A0A9P4WNU4_9PLEO|nr:hypothetical protein E8E12_005829 [Didymella heteroderae]